MPSLNHLLNPPAPSKISRLRPGLESSATSRGTWKGKWLGLGFSRLPATLKSDKIGAGRKTPSDCDWRFTVRRERGYGNRSMKISGTSRQVCYFSRGENHRYTDIVIFNLENTGCRDELTLFRCCTSAGGLKQLSQNAKLCFEHNIQIDLFRPGLAFMCCIVCGVARNVICFSQYECELSRIWQVQH